MRLRLIAALLAGLVSVSCGGTPTSPADTPVSKSVGRWAGTTSQGASISFEVSSTEMLTSLSIGYSFNGCSGTQTFTNLSIPTSSSVTCIPGPCSESLTSYRALTFSDGSFLSGPMTSVNGVFLPGGRIEGVAGFRDYPGCGTAISVPWSATRQ